MRKEAKERESLLAIPLEFVFMAHGTDRLYIYITQIINSSLRNEIECPLYGGATPRYIARRQIGV
jgi:hypothetical protein